MCRLFGFRSVVVSQVHRSLVSAENALLTQSDSHPDGWGVAYYQGECPHVVKSTASAFHDSLFTQVSGVVSSNTVIAHLRKATQGSISITNTHPFQFGRWVFAHNGNVKGFPRHRSALTALVAPGLARFILGDTDSELLFYLLLSALEKRVNIHEVEVSAHQIFEAIEEMVGLVIAEVGPLAGDEEEGEGTFLSFLLTNGSSLVAFHGGMPLLYSTYKTRCSMRESCLHLSAICEAPSTSGRVNHFIVSSEELQGENVWLPLKRGMMVGVDRSMMLASQSIHLP